MRADRLKEELLDQVHSSLTSRSRALVPVSSSSGQVVAIIGRAVGELPSVNVEATGKMYCKFTTFSLVYNFNFFFSGVSTNQLSTNDYRSFRQYFRVYETE